MTVYHLFQPAQRIEAIRLIPTGPKCVSVCVAHLYDEEEISHDLSLTEDGYNIACTPSLMTFIERVRFSWRVLREVWIA